MACHTVRAVGWHPEEEGREAIGVGGLDGGGGGGGRGTGIGGALLPKCQQASGERETEVRGFGGRQAGRQADWKEPADSEIRA